VVRWLEKVLPGGRKRPWLKRALIIIGIYLVGLVLVGGWLVYTVNVVAVSFAHMAESAPQFFGHALEVIEDRIDEWRQSLPLQVQREVEGIFGSMGTAIGDALKTILFRGLSVAGAGAGMVLGFVSLPFFLFFVLKDWELICNRFYSWMPPWVAEHTKAVAGIVERVLGRYIRAQLIMAVFVAVMVFIMLEVLAIPYAPALATLAGVMEFVPLLGVWIGAGVGVAVGLATDPGKVIWLVLGYFLIQQILDNILAPRIQGGTLRLHPAAIIVVGVVSAYLAGLPGIVFGVPLAATFVEVGRYIMASARKSEG
ncbi:MAG: AI-2E family transporter, partial [Dehalococcoidia bacterium]|nr:AI-2E family transporter [Dehalococcoidia bacterium]